jgi:hypothetical protein
MGNDYGDSLGTWIYENPVNIKQLSEPINHIFLCMQEYNFEIVSGGLQVLQGIKPWSKVIIPPYITDSLDFR